MTVLNALLASLVAVVAGSCVGAIFGFSLNANRDIRLGYRPNTTNRFLLFICRPSSEFSAVDGLLFFVLVIAELLLLVLLIAAPVLTASVLSGAGSPVISLSLLVFFVAAYFALNIGKNLWLRLI